MKNTFKKYASRVLAVSLCLALLIPSMIIPTSAGAVATALGGSTVTSSTVTDGLTYEKVTFTKGGAGQTAYVMQFNPKTSGLIPLGYQYESGTGSTVANTVSVAQSDGYTVYGAVNGEFFSPASMNYGTLTGRLISNGRIISDHEHCNEYALAIDNQGGIDLVKSNIAYHFYVEGQEVLQDDGNPAIARINKLHNQTWAWPPICYFDSACGTKADTISQFPGVEVLCNKINGTELTVEGILEGEVVSVGTNTYGTAIGENQFVLYVEQNQMLASKLSALTAGQKVQIYAEELNDDAREAMTNAFTATSATYPIVVNGVDNTLNTPNASDIYLTPAQRTAIGVKADGTYVFFCSAGRGTSAANTNGITLPQLAETMISLGCVTAVNLDGGGSSTMNVNGTTVFTGDGRKVASSILIVDRNSAKTTDAYNEVNNWMYNANTTDYSSPEQAALVAQAVAEAQAVYDDSNSLDADYVRATMNIKLAMGVTTNVLPKPYISLNYKDWTYDSSIMQVANNSEGALVLNNTNGQWPIAQQNCVVSVPLDYIFSYDFTVAGQSSFVIDGSDSKKMNMAFTSNVDSGSGDLGAGTYSGTMTVSDLMDKIVEMSKSASSTALGITPITRSDLLDENGNFAINSLRVAAVGGAGDPSKVTIRTFSFTDPYQGGNVNADAYVNSADARMILRYHIGSLQFTEAQIRGADANGDGSINTTDVIYILKKGVGLN